MNDKKILILGGAGYLGSVFTEHLLREKFKVTVIDRFIFGQDSLNHLCHDQSKSISSLGAIISGINLSNKISSEEKAVLNNLWSKFYVLIFPNQILEHKEFENFSLTFGKFGHDYFYNKGLHYVPKLLR